MNDKDVKIEVVFIGKPQWEAGWPYLGYDNTKTIDSIKKHLNEKFRRTTFNYNEIVTNYNVELIKEIKEDIEGADGVIIFTIGHYGEPGIVQAGVELIETRKPAILANFIYAGDHTFTKIFSTIKDKGFQIVFLSSQNIEHFDKMFENMFNLMRLRGKKILVYAKDTIEMNWQVILGLFNPERRQIANNHPEFLNRVGEMRSDEEFEFYTDTIGLDQAHKWRKDEKHYNKILKSVFDVEMIRGDSEEILEYYNKVNIDQANEIAQKWTKNATIVEPTEKTILNSAKLYIAFKNILKDKEIDIFAPDCGTFLLCGAFPAYPCMAFFELSKEGKYGICESDMDSAISFLFGLYLTGRPGYVSNQTLDMERNQITYMHCVAPCNLQGADGPQALYDIVYHGETHFLGASPRVIFPIGKPVTTIKISVFEKKISIRTGKIIDNIVDEKGCVSKMLVESNVEMIMKNYDWSTFGWHRVTFIGDWKEDFMNGAKILGLEIVEEDI
ncbi:MAG: hypothetical protein HWN80_16330 [Candidatus Lokiarchaeota archaeon]|nr:hypothetical protein [Candidatus Lokiarchaeota archaeon]